MSSGRVNKTKIDADMDEDGSAVSCQTILMLLLLYTEAHLNSLLTEIWPENKT